MAVLGGLIGDSPRLLAVRTQVEQLLQRQAGSRRLPPVLILGETGTGKGMLAGAIHEAGPRAAGPFVAVNCAAIPETLLEAELFGFERGAFTDARHAKAGLLQSANRGTLFLDEIGLLPQSLQVKLLTALEDRQVRRLGSTRSEPVDVWIISATSEDLGAGARRRGFREDLYHRLAVVTLRLPPLRERGSDILTLAEHFLARTCSDYGLTPKTLTEDARAALRAYRWPGNIRELANLMERVMLLSDTSRVTAEALGLGVSRSRAPSRAEEYDLSTPRAHKGSSLEHAVGELEQTRMLEALQETQGNISRAAARLGVTRNILRYRLKKYGLHAVARRAEPAEPPIQVVAPTPAPRAAHAQWERRHVALLRADLVPKAPLDIGRAVGATLEALVDKIESFGGRIEELSPGGLVAVFGVESIEDAPRRAAHAALAIQKLAAHAPGRSAEFHGVRVGLHVGQFLVACVGNTPRLDHATKREAWVQLEALVGNCEAGTVLVSGATRPFLERRFVLVPRSAGTGTAGLVCQLVGLERTGLGLGERLTPFVARRHELDRLAQALTHAQMGHGQVVAVVGEPGVGKSRLIWEFIEVHRDQDSRLLVCSAASYGKQTPYLPVIDLLKAYFQIEPHDEANTVKEKLTEKVLSLEPALAPALSALLALFDMPTAVEWQELDPQQKRRWALEAVKLLLLEQSRRQSLVLVFEDLHWIDSETQAVLDSLVDSLPGHRVLLIGSFRPEYQHGWGGKTYYAQLRLDSLLPESAHALLDSLVGRDETTAALKKVLIERTDGNPFFLEESVRTLVETGVLAGGRGAYQLARPVGELAVPFTVQAVLAARIDRLSPEEKDLLQMAAVIGKDVPFAMLRAIADLPEALLRAGLLALQRSEFLYETRLVPELDWAFKHALTHEVAYAGLFQDRRRVLHARMVTAIEQLYANRLSEQVDRLAHHALRSEIWDKAFAYFRQAGAKAAERSAYREAVACFEQALGALTHLSETRETIEQGIDLRLDLRNSLYPLGEHQRIFDCLREGEALAERIGDQHRLGWISAHECAHFWATANPDRAVEPGQRALAAARAYGDLGLQVVANLRLGLAYQRLGDLCRARACFQSNIESLEGDLIRERFGEPGLVSVRSRIGLGNVLVERGDFAEGIVRGEEGVRIAETVDNPFSLVEACRHLGLLYLRKGDLVQAVAILERGHRLCQAWSIPTWLYGVASFLGYAYVVSGRLADGLPLLDQFHQAILTGRRDYLTQPIIYLSEAYGLANREEDAIRLANQALDFSRRHKRRMHEAWALRALGEIASHRNPPDDEKAEAFYREAIVLADELDMRPIVSHCHLGLGRLCGRVGRHQEAREHLTTAATMYREMEMRFWLAQTGAQAATG